MALSLRVTAAALALLLLGCGGSIMRPLFVADRLDITLTLSSDAGDASRPITAHVRVTNVGRGPVHYAEDCVNPALELAIRPPDRRNVIHPCGECPNPVCPGCAGLLKTLGSGESIERDVVYGGTLLHCDGPYVGPPGRYSVEAGLSATTQDGRVLSVSRTASFSWSVPVAR